MMAFAHRLPFISIPLFGDRKRYGPVPDQNDPHWLEWLERQNEFFEASQRTGAGLAVNRAGYRIMRHIDLAGRKVLEIGPADILHSQHWTGQPAHWTSFDYQQSLLGRSAEALERLNVPHTEGLADHANRILPFADDEFDVAVSFYALEHFHPLDAHLSELRRVLKPGGKLVGAIPCEGGAAWGLGRFLTTRRWLLKNTTIDPGKIICWEHPNFADFIVNRLDAHFTRDRLAFWPLMMPLIDVNLVASFVYAKSAATGSA